MTHAVEQHVYAGSAFLPVLGTICGRLGDVALAFGGALCTSHSGYEWRTCASFEIKSCRDFGRIAKALRESKQPQQQGAYSTPRGSAASPWHDLRRRPC